MGYPTGQVDIAGLAKAGSTAEHTAATFTHPHSPLVPAGALDGWTSAAALAHAAQVWTTFLGNLAGQVRDFGADLSASAAQYQDADTTAAHRVAAAGSSQAPR